MNELYENVNTCIHSSPIRHFVSTLVVTLHLRPLRSTDGACVEPRKHVKHGAYAGAQTRNKH